MVRCDRNEMKGHILKRVITRIDYNDLFELDPGLMKNIAENCFSSGLFTKQGYKSLELSDFAFNDPSVPISLPYEYIKDINSIIFYNDERTYYLEINQLFLRITQVVGDEYRRYSESIDLINKCFEELKKNDLFHVKRMGIRKLNQVFFKDLSQFNKYFKPDLFQFNQFDNINWSNMGTQSKLVQNFQIDDIKVNFTRLYDNGLIDGNQFNRLILDFETYFNELDKKEDLIKKLILLNDKIYELFEWTLSDEGVVVLKSGERLGDI